MVSQAEWRAISSKAIIYGKQYSASFRGITARCAGYRDESGEGYGGCVPVCMEESPMLGLRNSHLRGIKILSTSPSIDTGVAYERHWPTTIRMHERGIFDEAPPITHRYSAEDIDETIRDNMETRTAS